MSSQIYDTNKVYNHTCHHLLTHGHADVGLLQGRRVVHSVPRDRHNLALALESLDNHQLLLGRSAREHNLSVIDDYLVQLLFRPDFFCKFLGYCGKFGSTGLNFRPKIFIYLLKGIFML